MRGKGLILALNRNIAARDATFVLAVINCLEHGLRREVTAHAMHTALNNLSLVHSDRSEVDQAITLTASALTECAALGDRHRKATLHNNPADLFHEAGKPAEAMRHLKQAVTIFAEIGVESGALQPEIWKLAEW